MSHDSVTPFPGSERSPAAEAKLEEFVRQYSALVRSAIVRTGGAAGANEGDEIEQRVWMALWRQIRREQTIQHPTSYIYRAAVRETVRFLRRERRFEEKAVAADAGEIQVHTKSPERQLESLDTGAQIREVLSRLHEPRRRAVQAHLMGYTAQEIMAMHDWPYQKARNLIARGMADLRRGLAERGLAPESRAGSGPR